MNDLTKKKNPHRGSSLIDFLKEDGVYEEVSSRAAMRAISENLKQKFEECRLTRTDFAKRMGSSRTAVNRLLDGRVDSVTVRTLVRAASALGVEFVFELRKPATKPVRFRGSRASIKPVERARVG